MTTLVAERLADPLALAVDRCRQEQVLWAQRPVQERLKPVSQFRRLLVAGCDRLCAAVIDDVGKLEAEALGEVLSVAEACRFLERRAAGLLAPRKVAGRPFWLRGQSDRVHRRPRGVVGIIGTRNYPLFLSGIQIIQALSAGNAVVWKPSELARSTGEVMADLLGRAGYPAGLFHVMEPTREGGPLLVESDIDHLVFTGSAATGRAIARRLGERLISSTLELSGCDAQLVLADADVKLAASAAWFGSTLNRGQTCIGVRRALVHRSLYDRFVDTLRPWAESAGPMRLVLPAQAAQLERLVADAVDRGGRVLAERVPAGA